MPTKITQSQVHRMAALAHIPVTEKDEAKFAAAFEETFAVINQLKSVDVTGVEPTHQVTGLENRFREDIIDESHTFTQAEALSNAPQTHNGYFVVPRLIDQE